MAVDTRFCAVLLSTTVCEGGVTALRFTTGAQDLQILVASVVITPFGMLKVELIIAFLGFTPLPCGSPALLSTAPL